MPVNNSGRGTIVDIKVAGAESITAGGRTHEARRIEPTFAIAVAPRVMPQATVWVSRDARRLPLRIKVSAAFGTVELELTDYQAK